MLLYLVAVIRMPHIAIKLLKYKPKMVFSNNKKKLTGTSRSCIIVDRFLLVGLQLKVVEVFRVKIFQSVTLKPLQTQ
jgi:hypothetical protein